MIYKFEFNELNKQEILNNNKDKILIEEQHYLDGKFLVFSDVKPLENQLADIQQDNLKLMKALADIYENLP